MIDLETIQKLQTQIAELNERLSALEEQKTGRKKISDGYLSIQDAADYSGKTVQAIQTLLKRDGANPDGIHPRRIHGGVHRGDFIRFVESRKIVGSGEQARRSVERLGR